MDQNDNLTMGAYLDWLSQRGINLLQYSSSKQEEGPTIINTKGNEQAPLVVICALNEGGHMFQRSKGRETLSRLIKAIGYTPQSVCFLSLFHVKDKLHTDYLEALENQMAHMSPRDIFVLGEKTVSLITGLEKQEAQSILGTQLHKPQVSKRPLLTMWHPDDLSIKPELKISTWKSIQLYLNKERQSQVML